MKSFQNLLGGMKASPTYENKNKSAETDRTLFFKIFILFDFSQHGSMNVINDQSHENRLQDYFFYPVKRPNEKASYISVDLEKSACLHACMLLLENLYACTHVVIGRFSKYGQTLILF